jgi:hypothetical protein
MNEILLSDWTLAAFKQREEERRRRQQNEAAPVPSNKEAPRGNETLRSDWTIAALQKRFTTLEQRLAALEQRFAALQQREEERRLKEKIETTARVSPREEKPHDEEVSFSNSTVAASQQRNEDWRAREQPEFVQAKAVSQEIEAISHGSDKWPERKEAAETVRRDEGEGLQRERIAISAVRNGETPHVGMARKMARWLISILITASVAAAMGFAIAIYAVPTEKAAHFRTLIKRQLQLIDRGHSSQEKR